MCIAVKVCIVPELTRQSRYHRVRELCPFIVRAKECGKPGFAVQSFSTETVCLRAAGAMAAGAV